MAPPCRPRNVALLNQIGAIMATMPTHTHSSDGLVLDIEPDGRIVLHQVSHEGRARGLGTFSDAAEAWKAIDEIDAPAYLADAA